MKNWADLADEEMLTSTVAALKTNNITALVVNTGMEAKQKVLELIPKGAQVMTMSSETLIAIGLTKDINESGDYDAVKPKLLKMDRATQSHEMQKLGSTPEWTVGSVHAVTQDGHTLIASNTGSQLPAYVYGSTHVIWVVGTQKIVTDTAEGMKRIYEYVLPLESARMKKVYNVPSNVSKLLIFNKEIIPNRITLIFVKEKLGF